MERADLQIPTIRRSMMFLSITKIFLLFVGARSISIAGSTVQISENFDRIIFLLTMAIGWKVVYFVYATFGGPRGLVESSNHVVASLFAFFPVFFGVVAFCLACGTWLPAFNDIFNLDTWTYRREIVNEQCIQEVRPQPIDWDEVKIP